MDPRYDINTAVVNHDITWEPSDTQHVEDTINASPGWWKENPADGVDIRRYLNSAGMDQVLKRSISVNLRADLYTVTNPIVKFLPGDQLYVQPNAILT